MLRASCIHLFAFPKWKLQTVGKLKFWLKKEALALFGMRGDTFHGWSKPSKVKKFALNSQFQTIQLLTNNVQTLILFFFLFYHYSTLLIIIVSSNVCYEKTDTLSLLYTEAKVYQFFRNRR